MSTADPNAKALAAVAKAHAARERTKARYGRLEAALTKRVVAALGVFRRGDELEFSGWAEVAEQIGIDRYAAAKKYRPFLPSTPVPRTPLVRAKALVAVREAWEAREAVAAELAEQDAEVTRLVVDAFLCGCQWTKIGGQIGMSGTDTSRKYRHLITRTVTASAAPAEAPSWLSVGPRQRRRVAPQLGVDPRPAG